MMNTTMEPQPVIYIAGPFTADTDDGIRENIAIANNWSMSAWKRGFAAVCPHMNTANGMGICDEEVFLKGDISIMLRCDAVLLVPGWERSAGTRKEIDVAKSKAIPVFTTLGAIERHFGQFDTPTEDKDNKTA